MASTSKITDRKSTGYQKLIDQLPGLRGTVVEFGIFGAKGGDEVEGVLSIVEIAAVHEFGSATVPQRSFLRAYVDENRGLLQNTLARLLKTVLAGKLTLPVALERFGAFAVGGIKERIAAGIAPELKPATKRAKGGDKDTPLILSGQMRNSITYRVSGANIPQDFPAPEGGGGAGGKPARKLTGAAKASHERRLARERAGS